MSKSRRSFFIFSFIGIAAALTGLYLNFHNEISHEEISDIVTWEEIASGQVRPQGYGLTVFKGTKVEKFEVEFEGVVPHPIIRDEKMILVRMGKPLIGSNVLSGMSGSPVYFYKNGKPHILGAIAFGFPIPTAGKSIGGITPINAMLNQQKLAEKSYLPLRKKFLENIRLENLLDEFSKPVPVGRHNGQPIELLQPMFTTAFSSGTAKSGNGQVRRPKPGEAVTMMLADGDVKLGATCTVTYVTEDKFWACGHPILMDGEMVAPAKLASIAAPFKGPFDAFKLVQDQHDVVGYISYDGAFAIEGYIKEAPPGAMIPISLNVKINKQNTAKINYSVFRNKLYTGPLIEDMGMKALESVWNIKKKATTKSAATVHYDESKITLYDTSVSGSMTNFGPFIVMSNPWSIIGKTAGLIGFLAGSEWGFKVKGASINIDLEPGEKVFSLDSIKVLNSNNSVADSLTPGSTAYLLIALRSSEGAKKFVAKIPVNIPKNLEFKKANPGDPLTVTFAVESGNNYREKDETKVFSGRPESKEEFLKQLLVDEREPQKIYIQTILPPTNPKAKDKRKVGEKFGDSWKPVKSLKPLHSARATERKIITKELDSPLSDYALNVRGMISLPITVSTATASSAPKNP
jgi:hypothetical protein